MLALLSRELSKMTTPAASGLVWWATQLILYNKDLYCSNSSGSKRDVLLPRQPLETLTGMIFSMMYLRWSKTTLPLVTLICLPEVGLVSFPLAKHKALLHSLLQFTQVLGNASNVYVVHFNEHHSEYSASVSFDKPAWDS